MWFEQYHNVEFLMEGYCISSDSIKLFPNCLLPLSQKDSKWIYWYKNVSHFLANWTYFYMNMRSFSPGPFFQWSQSQYFFTVISRVIKSQNYWLFFMKESPKYCSAAFSLIKNWLKKLSSVVKLVSQIFCYGDNYNRST